MPSIEGEPAGRRIRGLNADERRLQRRRQLLDAALEVFAAEGYPRTSIEQICQTAYVGTKAFYEVFASKEACYIALLQDLTQQIEDKVLAAIRTAPKDDTDPIPRIVATFAHALVDDPRVARATFGEAAGISPAVERQRRENRRWSAAFVETLWRRYDDLDQNQDYSRMAIGAIGGMFELIADWLLDASDSPTFEEVEVLVTELYEFAEVVRVGIRSRSAETT